MRFQSSDPDVETLVRRIERKLIDLQPDFQRGEVWAQSKKQRLIDSILRGWHIPPIHLIQKPDGKWDVLDGQQRLTAIRDFIRGDFPVNGAIEPQIESISALAGCRWGNLPEKVQEKFNSFTIRVFELTDYQTEEPYELFFRLNQPTNLTEAEKRNAFIGGARNQVKELVAWATECGMNKTNVGFTNARMAYDDVISRFVLTLEAGQLNVKITSARVTERYRRGDEFSADIMNRAGRAIELVTTILSSPPNGIVIKPNKATLHTWLCMAGEILLYDDPDAAHSVVVEAFSRAVHWIEARRASKDYRTAQSREFRELMDIFDDRATSRVLDVSSIILRDLVGWMVIYALSGGNSTPPYVATMCEDAWSLVKQDKGTIEFDLAEFTYEHNWGGKGWI
ncbi:hypothetical protein CK505_16730 [Kocuria sp. WN036]|uniref:DUF262 domain-containing protein n=1 Tax=Kocuria sp. WN036 TaxID=2032628 RepID=UPI000BABDFF2|nr:DUF262 domain-containing protein [Kocuria sp. WN036]PAU86001.1 hypothetical protein CK505_16730 [Kocuria sp. WN036]